MGKKFRIWINLTWYVALDLDSRQFLSNDKVGPTKHCSLLGPRQTQYFCTQY